MKRCLSIRKNRTKNNSNVFTLQKRRYYTVKALILHGKSYAFAMQYQRFCKLLHINILQGLFLGVPQTEKQNNLQM